MMKLDNIKLTPKQKRKEIKRLLGMLDEKNHKIFKYMYSHQDLEKDINLIVDEMPAKQLSWALTQCQNTYYSLFDMLRRA